MCFREALDERCLANPGLATDKHETTIAAGNGTEEALQFIEEVFALEQFHSLPETGTSFEPPVGDRRQMILLKMRSRRVGPRNLGVD